ncbi:protein SON isoform X2 [Hermetia illucens]|uniref:protein SON isoform X2 n=1 Tax=Hermetia illucens TaxID=343691 RepID=UPI0018CBFB07|nr:protein SON isoform X2 [Hermetia illucens]
MSGELDFDYTKVKIKQEKPSPPRVPQKDEIIDEIIPKLFNPNPERTSGDDEKEEKKPVEPVKSSNEILAELFRVFNATPPESLLNDNFLLDKKEKKRKEKKHKKKSKKRSRDTSDEYDSSDNEKRKKKKRKKHKKHKKENEKADVIPKIKEENTSDDKKKDKLRKSPTPPDNIKVSDISDFTISSEDEGDIRMPVAPIAIKKERKCSPKPAPGKIIIKNLKSSKVLEEAEKRLAKEKPNAESGECSEISLSDEETYLREQKERSRSSQGYYDRRERGYPRNRPSGNPFRDRSRDRFKRRWRNSRSRSRSRSRYRRRSRSRSRSHRPEDLVIDKKRLLEIARKNAISMFKNGSLPGTQSMPQEVKNKVLMKMRYGGKSVEELTEFCKKLSNGENLNDLSSLSSNEDSDYDKLGNDKAFHHPFILKDRGPIVMNIKNATPIPPKTADQAKAILMQYPVSSGQQHKLNESEWVPVPTSKPVRTEPPATVSIPKPVLPKNVFEKPLPADTQQPAFVPTNQPAEPSQEIQPLLTTVATPVAPVTSTVTKTNQPITPTVARVPEVPIPQPAPSIFPQVESHVDVTSIIAKRLNAMRKLQENPTDPEALKMMYNSQRDMSTWAISKTTPGQFTGSTGANILTARELTAGQQAWVKRIWSSTG